MSAPARPPEGDAPSLGEDVAQRQEGSPFTAPARPPEGEPYRRWICLICGWTYDEKTGCADHGLPPGTRWASLPMNWVCPDCGARKEDFEMIGAD